MKYVIPEFKEKAFHCPLCGTFSHMQWDVLNTFERGTDYYEAMCSCCNKPSLWRVTEYSGHAPISAELTYPDKGSSPVPVNDMPSNVKNDYLEASRIFSRSPRGAAALLRLGLQKLCIHLGEPGKNINNDIRALSEKTVLPPLVIKVADTVRITGNNAVHPGEMSDDDFDHVASKMFELLNFIVKKGISEPKELEALYSLTPEKPRKAAEAKDKSAKNA